MLVLNTSLLLQITITLREDMRMNSLFLLNEGCLKSHLSDYGFSEKAELLSVFRNLISKTVPEAASQHEYTVGNKRLNRKISQMGKLVNSFYFSTQKTFFEVISLSKPKWKDWICRRPVPLRLLNADLCLIRVHWHPWEKWTTGNLWSLQQIKSPDFWVKMVFL